MDDCLTGVLIEISDHFLDDASSEKQNGCFSASFQNSYDDDDNLFFSNTSKPLASIENKILKHGISPACGKLVEIDSSHDSPEQSKLRESSISATTQNSLKSCCKPPLSVSSISDHSSSEGISLLDLENSDFDFPCSPTATDKTGFNKSSGQKENAVKPQSPINTKQMIEIFKEATTISTELRNTSIIKNVSNCKPFSLDISQINRGSKEEIEKYDDVDKMEISPIVPIRKQNIKSDSSTANVTQAADIPLEKGNIDESVRSDDHSSQSESPLIRKGTFRLKKSSVAAAKLNEESSVNDSAKTARAESFSKPRTDHESVSSTNEVSSIRDSTKAARTESFNKPLTDKKSVPNSNEGSSICDSAKVARTRSFGKSKTDNKTVPSTHEGSSSSDLAMLARTKSIGKSKTGVKVVPHTNYSKVVSKISSAWKNTSMDSSKSSKSSVSSYSSPRPPHTKSNGSFHDSSNLKNTSKLGNNKQSNNGNGSFSNNLKNTSKLASRLGSSKQSSDKNSSFSGSKENLAVRSKVPTSSNRTIGSTKKSTIDSIRRKGLATGSRDSSASHISSSESLSSSYSSDVFASSKESVNPKLLPKQVPIPPQRSQSSSHRADGQTAMKLRTYSTLSYASGPNKVAPMKVFTPVNKMIKPDFLPQGEARTPPKSLEESKRGGRSIPTPGSMSGFRIEAPLAVSTPNAGRNIGVRDQSTGGTPVATPISKVGRIHRQTAQTNTSQPTSKLFTTSPMISRLKRPSSFKK